MKSAHFFNRLKPYLFIAITGILAFAPVSFMVKSLKNDLVALEYPINYFMSQCIHNGQLPYWFNTWGMGFPLQSTLTWGIFSTPQMLFCSLFDYNMYALHLEFMSFVVLSGWGMYFLLRRHFNTDSIVAQLLSIGYMLSGFTVGSSQWMLYITATALIPFTLHAFLQLLKAPSTRNAFFFAILYTVMFTSVYAAFNIITTYALALVFIFFLLQPGRETVRPKVIRFTILGVALAGLLCLPAFYYTVELLSYMERGSVITTRPAFFNSNYLHPLSMGSVLFPLSSTRMSFPNTEGTLLDSYMGLFTLLIIPLSLRMAIKEKNRIALFLFGASLIFLFLSFGPMTPLRSSLNVLPGFAYFRNPGMIRMYFIFLLMLFIACSLRDRSLKEIFSSSDTRSRRILFFTFAGLGLACIAVVLSHIDAANSVSLSSIGELFRNLSYSQSLFINAILQLVLLPGLYLLWKTGRFGLMKCLLSADLIINSLLCMPSFAVSSYSPGEVNHILLSQKGFPVQHVRVSESEAVYTDQRLNSWNNVNIFHKEISSAETYRGPLTLKEYATDSLHPSLLFQNLPAFTKDSSSIASILLQTPLHIRVSVQSLVPDSLIILQNYFPGWKAFYNDKEISIIKRDFGMSIPIPAGKGLVDFKYQRNFIWIWALLLHVIVLVSLIIFGIQFFRNKNK